MCFFFQRFYTLFVDAFRKLKTKMCLALQSVEKDLIALSQMQKKISGVANYVHKTPLGIMLPRKAGKTKLNFICGNDF